MKVSYFILNINKGTQEFYVKFWKIYGQKIERL
jgi:hypothetical protein